VWSGHPLKPIRYSKQVRFLNIEFYRVFFNYSIYAEFQTLVFHFKLALQCLQQPEWECRLVKYDNLRTDVDGCQAELWAAPHVDIAQRTPRNWHQTPRVIVNNNNNNVKQPSACPLSMWFIICWQQMPRLICALVCWNKNNNILRANFVVLPVNVVVIANKWDIMGIPRNIWTESGKNPIKLLS